MRAVIRAGQIRTEDSRVGRRRPAGKLMAALLSCLAAPVLMAAPAATTTTLAVTANGLNVSSVNAGTLVTLTATVETGGKALALGQVNFCDATAKLCSDIHLLGTVGLSSSGQAALKFVPRAGTHSYKAEFVSTVNDAASSSADQSLVVYGITKTTITQSGSAGNYTLKATVTGQANAVAPAGNVEFRDTSAGNAVLATAALGTGTSSSSWTNTQNPATQPQPLSIIVGDFNGDGIPDLAIGTNGTTTGYLEILLGNGDGTFQAAKSFTALPNNQAMVAAPFVNGGPLDILTVDNNASGTNNAAMFLGNGAGGGTVGTPFSLGGLAQVNGIAAADFNRDGSEDFVITGIIYGTWCFAPVLGTGYGTFGSPTLNAIGDNPLAVAVGAFNTNGYPDIVVADSGMGQVTIFQNNSQGYFFPEGQANTGTTPIAMITGDFNGDGYLDLAVVNNGSDNVNIFLGAGNETLTAGATVSVGHAPTSIAVGDFNGDGIADLAVVNSGDKNVFILLGKGDGTFVASTPQGTGINPVNVATGDFSGTGISNLAVTNQDIAATTGSTLTVQAAQLTETATATATKVDPLGTGTHLVDANYVGDSLYNTSLSATTSLTGMSAPAATPVLSLAAGAYPSAQTVTMTDSSYGAVIYYTTNGTIPTAGSTKYSAAITVNASETIEAIAVATGFTNSAVATAEYTIGTGKPPVMTSPAPGSTLQSATATFTWNAAATGNQGYWLFLGTTGVGSKNLYDSGQQAATSATFTNLPTDGATLYARIYTRFNGVLVYNDYTYTAWMKPPVMVSPTAGSTLPGTSATFTWTAETSDQGYWLFLGTTGIGSKNLYDSGQQTATSATVSNLPANGETIYARIYTRYNGVLVYNDYTYVASMQKPVLTSPVPGSTLPGTSATFTWTAAAPGNQGYWLFLGTTGVGSKNLYYSGQQTATSATVSGLPTNGATVYARLYTRYNGVLVYNDYTYKAQ